MSAVTATRKRVPLETVVHPKVSQRGPGEENTFTYVDIGSVDNKLKRIVDPKTLEKKTTPSRAKQVLKTGDVLVSMTRPNLNAVAIVPESLNGSIGSTGFHVLRSRDALPEWLFYAVQSSDFIDSMCRVVQGALYPAVRPKDILNYQIPLPSLEEQRAIVSDIEKQFTRLEAGVAALRRVQANLKRYRASILKAACEGRLVPTEAELARTEERAYEPAADLLKRIHESNESKIPSKLKLKPLLLKPINQTLPTGWANTSLESIAMVLDPNPKHRNPKYVTKGFPFLSTAQFGKVNGFDMATAKTVAEETVLDQERRCNFSNRTIAFSRKGTIAKTRFLPTTYRFALLDSLCVINPANELSAQYVNFALNGANAQAQVMKQIRGVALKQISVGGVRGLLIPVPPLAEQKRIVAEVERQLSVVDQLEAIVATNLQQAAHLRKSILQKAFTEAPIPKQT